MKIYTETERFILREVLLSDAGGFYELDSDPEVHLYLGQQPVTSKEQVLEAISFIREQYITNGIGRWAVIEKASGNFIGWSGLKLVTTLTNNHINYYDLGYRFIRRYWGKGIATETATAALSYAFNELGATAVYGMTDCNNTASDKVLRKVGLHFIETFNYENIPHNWYKIEKSIL